MAKVHAFYLSNTWDISSSKSSSWRGRQEKKTAGDQENGADVGRWICHFGGVKRKRGQMLSSIEDFPLRISLEDAFMSFE